eukprot:TRINITY_DN20476_c0_g1_i1.p1 TRINITY_DN20476_c0_g1~~TRINITY_DN20476_c0_g1_i1.p1  ORF type:complete len:746 (+),score=174.48 TRINITY_DN20476_c0_g1_i1:112-2349(+)
MSCDNDVTAGSPTLAHVVFPTLEFEVTKWHDKMRWLRQDRVLRLSDEGIENVKRKSGVAVTTKKFGYDTLKHVRLVERDYIILAFVDDHDYHYLTADAVRIAWEVNERMNVRENSKRYFKFISTRSGKPTVSAAFRRNKMPMPWDLEDRLVLRQHNSLLELQITEMLLAPSTRVKRWVEKLQSAADASLYLGRAGSPRPAASPTGAVGKRAPTPVNEGETGCRAVAVIGEAIVDVRRLVMEHYVAPSSTQIATPRDIPATIRDGNDLGITFAFLPPQRAADSNADDASQPSCQDDAGGSPASYTARSGTPVGTPCVATPLGLAGFGGEILRCTSPEPAEPSQLLLSRGGEPGDARHSPSSASITNGHLSVSPSPSPPGITNASFGMAGRSLMRKVSRMRDRGASSIEGKVIYVTGGEDELGKCIDRCLQKVLLQPSVADAAYREIHQDGGLAGKRALFAENHRFVHKKPIGYFGIPAKLHSCGWIDAVHELDAMAGKRLPHEKMSCIMLMVRQVFLIASVDSEENVEGYSLDNLLPLIIFVLARSSLAEPLVEAEYIMALSDSVSADEQAYYLTVFFSAIEYIAGLDRSLDCLFSEEPAPQPRPPSRNKSPSPSRASSSPPVPAAVVVSSGKKRALRLSDPPRTSLLAPTQAAPGFMSRSTSRGSLSDSSLVGSTAPAIAPLERPKRMGSGGDEKAMTEFGVILTPQHLLSELSQLSDAKRPPAYFDPARSTPPADDFSDIELAL